MLDPDRVDKLYSSSDSVLQAGADPVLTDNRLPDAIAQEIIRRVGGPEDGPDAGGKVTKE
jgi:hypothetical protein